jgi:hypothetical protein
MKTWHEFLFIASAIIRTDRQSCSPAASTEGEHVASIERQLRTAAASMAGDLPAKGKSKGGGKGKKGAAGSAPTGGVEAAPASGVLLEGVIVSVDGASGVIKAESGGEYGFRTKDVPDGQAVAGTKVSFAPAPAGKGKDKEGKMEVKFKSITVLAAGSTPVDPPSAEAASAEAPKPVDDSTKPGDAKEPSSSATEACGKDASEPTTEAQKERVLRDDEDCFVADYTGVQSDQPKTPKFEQFDKVRRARIARELVEMDPDVELRIREHPSKDAQEIRVLAADDIVEVVGTCGEWLRLAGDDEQWIKYRQSENPDIPEQLVDVLGPSIMSVASSFTSGWFSGAAAPAPEDEPASSGAADKGGKPADAGGGGGGWGFGSWGKSLTEKVSVLSSTMLAVGADVDAASSETASNGGSETAAAKCEKQEDFGAELAESVAQRFDKEVKLDEGGLASVRMASQAISIFEGGLGWLGSTASTAASSVQEKAKKVTESVARRGVVEGVPDNPQPPTPNPQPPKPNPQPPNLPSPDPQSLTPDRECR